MNKNSDRPAKASTANVWIGFAAIFAVSAIISAVAARHGNSDVKFKDSASVLAFITVLAVTIERGIEMLWTLLNDKQGFGGWWPLSIVADRAAEIETRLNDLLNGQFDRASEALKTAKISLASDDAVRGRVEAQLLELPQLQARLKARVVELQTLAPGSTRLAFAADAAADAQAFLSRAAAHTKDLSTTLKHGIDTASDAVNFATGVVASFQDNPARRTASLILGVSAGMVASAIVGINMFTAVLEQGAGRLLSGTLGVLATGIVIGLGSNPTHEVVKALQNYKKSRQPRTAASVTIETGEPLAERLHFEEANEEGLRRIQFDRSDRVLGITGPWTSVRSEPDAFRIVRRKTAIMIRTTD